MDGDGLNLLGATSSALSSQYITFRIKSIDREKLKDKIGGGTAGAVASGALAFADAEPKAALDVAKPLIGGLMKSYGIDADMTVSNVPPSKGGRPVSEFWPGLVLGTGVGVASLAIVKLIGRLFR